MVEPLSFGSFFFLSFLGFSAVLLGLARLFTEPDLDPARPFFNLCFFILLSRGFLLLSSSLPGLEILGDLWRAGLCRAGLYLLRL